MASQNKKVNTENPEMYAYGSNSSPADTIFNERQRYASDVFPDDLIPNFAETWNADRFYGTVSTKGNVVLADEKHLKPLRYTAGETQYAINFVADAWRDFSEKIRKLANDNILFKDSPWAKAEAHKAWDPPSAAYDEYMRTLVYPVFDSVFLPTAGRDGKIKGMNSFLDLFDDYVDNVIMSIGPLTLSGYLESGHMSPLCSGLMIEMADGAYDDDFQKSYEYYDDNFMLISQIAGEYGFLIDRNIPWRLVADLRSPAMQEYMHGVPIDQFDNTPEIDECDPGLVLPEILPEAFGFSQVPGMESVYRRISYHFDENGDPVPGYPEYQEMQGYTQNQVFEAMFSTAYTETWSTDADILQEHLLSFYNAYVAATPVVSIRERFVSVNCIPPVEVVERNQITRDEFHSQFGDRWKLKAFYTARISERDPRRDRHLMKKQVQRIMNIYNLSASNNYSRALRVVQEEFIGPYDVEPLTLDTVGDIIRSDRGRDDLSDSRRQNRVRRNIY